MARKTPQDWIDLGLTTLTKGGAVDLRAEYLARQIGATKGSFYWHFADVPAFHTAVLDVWSTRAQARFDAITENSESDVRQLRSLGEWVPDAQDLAIRAWATHHDGAAQAIADLEMHMLNQITGLLHSLGARHPDFPGLVLAALWSGSENDTKAETLIDLLLVLK